MKQSHAMSFVEAVANVAVGYGVAVATQIVVFPRFGFHPSFGDNLSIGLIFIGVSLVRNYALRRLFETVRVRSADRETAARAGGGLSVLSRISPTLGEVHVPSIHSALMVARASAAIQRKRRERCANPKKSNSNETGT